MNTLFDELKEGLAEAIQHENGEPTGVRVRAVTLPDVATAQEPPRQTEAPDAPQGAAKAI